jgi:hypothetical protein
MCHEETFTTEILYYSTDPICLTSTNVKKVASGTGIEEYQFLG